MLDDRILDLKKELIEYAALVQDMIEKSVRGLLENNGRLLAEVIEQEEPRANEWEITLDEACVTIIAQFQPRAGALRTILMVLGMNKDLERMGDHAVSIAKNALYLIDRPPVKPLLDIPRMAEEARAMVRDGLASFLHEDARLARSIGERDNIVDDLEIQVLRELITYMTSDPSTIERALHLLDIAKSLERIADLSTNIGEDVTYMVEGRVIKHHKEEQIRAISEEV